jgi:hypothetical protein
MSPGIACQVFVAWRNPGGVLTHPPHRWFIAPDINCIVKVEDHPAIATKQMLLHEQALAGKIPVYEYDVGRSCAGDVTPPVVLHEQPSCTMV